MIHPKMREAFPMMSLVESVENIVVGALSDQDRFARNDGIHMTPEKARGWGDWPKEPDSSVVTRDIILAVADALVEAQEDQSAYWLRSQANPGTQDDVSRHSTIPKSDSAESD